MKYCYWLIVVALLGGLLSCSSSKNVPYMIDAETIPEEVLNAVTPQVSPTITPGDIIDILVTGSNRESVAPFNKRLLQGEALARGSVSKPVEFYLVDQSGDIEFPTLGRLHIAGKTKAEVEHMIQAAR